MPIFKVFDGWDSELIIPVYQRNYSWKTEQCRQLLADLQEVIAHDRKSHFFGAVVGKTEGMFRWVVIDGQQRLTTTSLLVLALSHLLDAGELQSSQGPGLGAKIRRNYLLTDGGEGEARVKLKPYNDDSTAYLRLFQPDLPAIETSNVTANYRYFLREIPRLGCSADELWEAVCRLEIMHLDLEEHDDPQRIFESLNSTGLALSEADKIRNFVLMGMSAAQQEKLYQHYWNQIEKNVDYDTDMFLQRYLAGKLRAQPRADGIYASFKELTAREERDIEELLAEILHYSRYYRQLLRAETPFRRANERLARFNITRQDVVLPFLMSLLAAAESGEVSEAEFEQAIVIIDSYLFRRFICGVPTNSLNRIFATLWNELHKLGLASHPLPDVLTYALLRRESSGVFPDDDWFLREFSTRNMYAIRPDRRRHIFECLENQSSRASRDIAGRLEEGTLSIEHIMPQTLTTEWRTELGPDAEETHDTWLHRIGNLTVTGYNSRYSNASFANKKTIDGGFDTSPYRLNQELKTTQRWTAAEMESRSRRLAADAQAYWPHPQTDFEPQRPAEPEVPMGEETSFRHRVITGFALNGSRVTVDSWRRMLIDVLGLLAADHAAQLSALIDENPMLSTSTDGGFVAVAPGLCVKVNTNTDGKVALLRRIFAELGLDTDELTFFFRPGDAPTVDRAEEEEPAGEFAQLTQFLSEIDTFLGSDGGAETTSDLRREIRAAMTDHRVADCRAALGMPPVKFARSAELVADASAEQILALLTAKLDEEANYDDEALHEAIVDGTLQRWLQRLEEAA